LAPQVRLATPGDRVRVVGTLAAAFVADPVLRFIFPDDDDYRDGAPLFFGALFDKRMQSGTVWVADDGDAAALWDPPEASGSSDLRLLAAGARARVDQYDTAVHSALPAAPFWYLGVLGTHPDAAGRGLGRAVMAAGIDAAAFAELPAVLETSKLQNLEFYGRGGWHVEAVIDDPVRTWILHVNPVPPLARR